MDKPVLLLQLRFEEGVRLRVYRDINGIESIGIGRNLSAQPFFNGEKIPDEISEALAEEICLADIASTRQRLAARLRFFARLDAARQDACINMAFQLGVGGFMAFSHMICHLSKGEWQAAYDCALASEWGQDFPARAQRVANQLMTGVYYQPSVVVAV